MFYILCILYALVCLPTLIRTYKRAEFIWFVIVLLTGIVGASFYTTKDGFRRAKEMRIRMNPGYGEEEEITYQTT